MKCDVIRVISSKCDMHADIRYNIYLDIRELYMKISHLHKSPVDWSPSVGFGLLPLYDIALDRISSVILWRFPANNDVIPVLLDTLGHAGWERLIYGEKTNITLKSL